MSLWRAGEHPADGPQVTTAPLWVARGRARTHGWDVVEGSCAYATPAGPVTRPAHELLRDALLADLVAAGRIDAVLFGLDRAMMADGCDDVEADLLRRFRTIGGPGVIVGAAIVDAVDDDAALSKIDDRERWRRRITMSRSLQNRGGLMCSRSDVFSPDRQAFGSGSRSYGRSGSPPMIAMLPAKPRRRRLISTC